MIIHRGKKVMKTRRDIEVTVSDRKRPLEHALNNPLPEDEAFLRDRLQGT